MKRFLWLACFLLASPSFSAVFRASEISYRMVNKPCNMQKAAKRSLSFWAPLDSTTGLSAFGDGLSQAPTFARATVASFHGATGVVKVASGVPRFTPNGLLIEGARTNIETRSEELDNATYAKSNCSITADNATAPDGTATADKFIEAAGASAKYLTKVITGTASGTNALSCYAKANGRNWLGLGISGSTNDLILHFDIANGTVGTASETGGAYSATGEIEAVPGYAGWYRIKAVITTTADIPILMFILASDADATRSYTGDGASGCWIWGIQYESGGLFVSSYIPTTDLTVTRNQDTLSYSASRNLPLTAPGSMFKRLMVPFVAAANAGFIASTTSASDEQGVRMDYSNATVRSQVITTTTQANISASSALVSGVAKRVGMTWALNNVVAYVDGVIKGTDTVAAMPTGHTAIRLGADGGGSTPLYGNISNEMIFLRNLPESESGMVK